MGLSNYKLYGGDRKNNIITSTVNLYESLSDVQNQGYKIINNGQVLYAKYGEITDSKASRIRCRINGIEKALLTRAMIPHILVDNFPIDDRHSYVRGINRNYGEIRAWPESGKPSFVNYDQFQIPLNAKNIKFTVKNVRSNMPRYTLYLIFGCSKAALSNAISNVVWDVKGDVVLKTPELKFTTDITDFYRGVSLAFDSSELQQYIAFDSVIIEWETEN